MMPSGLEGGLGSGRFFLQVHSGAGFWHVGQIRPVSVEYTSRVSFIVAIVSFGTGRLFGL